MTKILRGLLIGLIGLLPTLALAAGKTELTWYGHAAFKLTTPTGKVLLIDPWITNPANKNGKEDLAKIDKADLILVTHGHGDHIGDSVEIAKRTGAQLVATFDLMKAMVQYRGYPKDQATGATTGNFGGEIALLDGEVKIAFIPAVHSSNIEAAADHAAVPGSIEAAGNPGGFLITVRNGPAIYHTGDTDVFADMALIGRFHPVDAMLACVGDKFTMGPDRAALATKLVNPRMVIPMHFGTFPALAGTPAALAKALKAQGLATPVREMKVGETLAF